MSNLKKILNLSIMQLSILLIVFVHSKYNKIGVKGKTIVKALEHIQTNKSIIEGIVMAMVKNKYLVIKDGLFYLDNDSTAFFQLLSKDINGFTLDKLVNRYISLATIRLYFLLKMKQYPHTNSNLRITYNEMVDSYNQLYNSNIDNKDLDDMLNTLIDEHLIIKHKYNRSNGDGYYCEYEFIDEKKLIELLF